MSCVWIQGMSEGNRSQPYLLRKHRIFIMIYIFSEIKKPNLIIKAWHRADDRVTTMQAQGVEKTGRFIIRNMGFTKGLQVFSKSE